MSLEKKVKKQLRRVRYSKRVVLLVVLLIVGFAVPVSFRASRQRNAVRSFNDYNASFFYNFEISQAWNSPFEKSSDVSDFKSTADSPMPEWLLKFAGVDFCHTVVAADVLAKDLNTIGRRDAIRRLNQMKFLNLTNWSGPGTSLDNIEFLESHRSLQSLNLYGNEKLSNIDQVAEFKLLRYLNLSKTHVQNLRILSGLSNLELLRIHDVDIEESEIVSFQESHPDCLIER